MLKKNVSNLWSGGMERTAFSMKTGPHQESAPVQNVTQVKAKVESTKVMLRPNPVRSSCNTYN